jgi:ABC-type Fe3+ transport system permease subunit
MRWRTRGWSRGSGRRQQGLLVVGLAVLAIWFCSRLLNAVWTIFQHAYVNSYWLVPGSQVNQVYWSSVRFAFTATVSVALVGAALLALVALELGRLRR